VVIATSVRLFARQPVRNGAPQWSSLQLLAIATSSKSFSYCNSVTSMSGLLITAKKDIMFSIRPIASLALLVTFLRTVS
jgi:hypothetical protein